MNSRSEVSAVSMCYFSQDDKPFSQIDKPLLLHTSLSCQCQLLISGAPLIKMRNVLMKSIETKFSFPDIRASSAKKKNINKRKLGGTSDNDEDDVKRKAAKKATEAQGDESNEEEEERDWMTDDDDDEGGEVGKGEDQVTKSGCEVTKALRLLSDSLIPISCSDMDCGKKFSKSKRLAIIKALPFWIRPILSTWGT